jgi:hypothetical protein
MGIELRRRHDKGEVACRSGIENKTFYPYNKGVSGIY